MTKFVNYYGNPCQKFGQKHPKTSNVLAGVFVLVNSLISGGAGERDKNGRFR